MELFTLKGKSKTKEIQLNWEELCENVMDLNNLIKDDTQDTFTILQMAVLTVFDFKNLYFDEIKKIQKTEKLQKFLHEFPDKHLICINKKMLEDLAHTNHVLNSSVTLIVQGIDNGVNLHNAKNKIGMDDEMQLQLIEYAKVFVSQLSCELLLLSKKW